MLAFEPSATFHPSPRWNVTCAHGWQGGGLYISGTATLTNTNLHSNQAGQVCWAFEHSLNFHPSSRWNLTSLSRVTRGSQGGGVKVEFGGVANFEGCNVHDNTAINVCSCLATLVALCTSLLLSCGCPPIRTLSRKFESFLLFTPLCLTIPRHDVAGIRCSGPV